VVLTRVTDRAASYPRLGPVRCPPGARHAAETACSVLPRAEKAIAE
jgi:hypothetical protein